MARYKQALAIRRDIGDVEGEGATLDHIGTLLLASGQPAAGRRYWYEAVVTLEKIGHPLAGESR